MATVPKEPGLSHFIPREETWVPEPNQALTWSPEIPSQALLSVPETPPKARCSGCRQSVLSSPHCPGPWRLGPSRLGGEVTGT